MLIFLFRTVQTMCGSGRYYVDPILHIPRRIYKADLYESIDWFSFQFMRDEIYIYILFIIITIILELTALFKRNALTGSQ